MVCLFDEETHIVFVVSGSIVSGSKVRVTVYKVKVIVVGNVKIVSIYYFTNGLSPILYI